MVTCKDCKMFMGLEEDTNKGECVQEELDPRGGKFWSSRPVKADLDSSKCPQFIARSSTK